MNKGAGLFRHARGATMNTGRWYRVENRAAQNTATVYIFDEIGEYGISASEFVNELNALQVPKIEIRMNTPGGNVFDGLAIFNAIKDHPAEVTIIVDGYAASAGSYILQAADKRVMNSFSQVMIHDAALAITMGNARDHRETADFLDKQSDNIAAIYASRTSIPADEWRVKMEAETWYTAEEAVDAGLADEWIVSTTPADDVALTNAATPQPVAIATADPPKVESEPADPWAGFDFGQLTTALSGATEER